MSWKDKIKQGLEFPAKFMAQNGQAQQAIPNQHRLLNAGGMFIGWIALDKIRHIVFGVQQKSEGEYVEVKREDVPAPLRFLHKTIDWDPHSETPENQWRKLAYQLFPGVGAGVGAVAGSMMQFEVAGRAHTMETLKKSKSLNLIDADSLAQYSQAMPLRILTAFFGTFSAASGLTFLYGLFLNHSFAAANGARIFSPFRGALNVGISNPGKALDEQLSNLAAHVKVASKSGGEISDAWAKQFSGAILEPLFGHELKTAASQEKARATLQKIVKESYHKFQKSGEPAEKIAKAVTEDITKKLGKANIEKTLRDEFHLDPAKATPGKANPIVYHPVKAFQDALGLKGISTYQKRVAESYVPQSPTKTV